MVYLQVFDTILAVLFWRHCNLCRSNLEKLLKSELQLSNRLLTRVLATSIETSEVRNCVTYLKSKTSIQICEK